MYNTYTYTCNTFAAARNINNKMEEEGISVHFMILAMQNT